MSGKKGIPKHIAINTSNLQRFRQNFKHIKRHIFMSLAQHFIIIRLFVWAVCNFLWSAVTNYSFLPIYPVLTDVICYVIECVDRQIKCFQMKTIFNLIYALIEMRHGIKNYKLIDIGFHNYQKFPLFWTQCIFTVQYVVMVCWSVHYQSLSLLGVILDGLATVVKRWTCRQDGVST